MNTLFTLIKRGVSVCAVSTFAFMSMPTMAEDGSVHHSGQASKHSALALSHGTGASAQVASAVVAVPIIAIGVVSVATGSAALSVGDSITNSGQHVSVNTHSHSPLTITDRVITADPAPNQVMPPPQKTSMITTTETHTAVKRTTTKYDLALHAVTLNQDLLATAI